MGRWGHCLFEFDKDIKLTVEVGKGISRPNGDQGAEFAWLLSRALVNAPLGVREFYTVEFGLDARLNDSYAILIRNKLQTGLGDQLFQKYRADLPSFLEYREHRVIILGALMMSVGAKIKDDDFHFLRELAESVGSSEHVASPISDPVFRGPGKRQFLAALDHFEAGIPRDFQRPSCHACGKINADGVQLKKCGGCLNKRSVVWFCDKDCQKDSGAFTSVTAVPLWDKGLAFAKFRGKSTEGAIGFEGAQC